MVLNMLKAVSKMLELSDSDTLEVVDVKVRCAQTMLDQIIQGMIDEAKVITTVPLEIIKSPTADVPIQPQPTTSTLPEKRAAKAGEVEIMVDAGKIKSIKNAQDDTMIQLDGIAYPWKRAIGRSFSEGKIL